MIEIIRHGIIAFYFIAIPFLLIYEAWKFIVRIVKGLVYDHDSKEWITKEEKEKNKLKERQKNREILLVVENHTTTNKDDRFYFFEKSCGLSAYILGVNPFDQPGVEEYKKNMFAILGRDK